MLQLITKTNFFNSALKIEISGDHVYSDYILVDLYLSFVFLLESLKFKKKLQKRKYLINLKSE